MNILDKIVHIDFPQEQYIPRKTEKKQIVIHHTVSPNNSVKGDIATWVNSKPRVATCIIIGGDGTPYQLFSSRYWAYHIGMKASYFKKLGLKYDLLDDNSIGIEIDSAGGLKKKNDKWYDVYGYHIPDNEVIEYPNKFRGYYGFQKYTNEQIDTLKELLIYWNDVYDISLDYNEDMWDVSIDALKGKNGIWTHVSYRKDKSDCHPQPELINMLKKLTDKQQESFTPNFLKFDILDDGKKYDGFDQFKV